MEVDFPLRLTTKNAQKLRRLMDAHPGSKTLVLKHRTASMVCRHRSGVADSFDRAFRDFLEAGDFERES